MYRQVQVFSQKIDLPKIQKEDMGMILIFYYSSVQNFSITDL